MSTGKSGKQSKNAWDRFSSFKQRGEWVELQFMAQAALRQFNVSRPWGDNLAYDVGIEHAPNFLRVQVKSTTVRVGAGYRCQCLPNKKHKYSLGEIDLFAAYVIPEDAWYLIPAVLLLGRRRRATAALCPVVPPAKKVSYRYECYREAWNLLNRSRAELAQFKVPPPPPSHHRKPGSRRVTKAALLRLD
jgi:PD-(D/E)XK nuclease superfamily protein